MNTRYVRLIARIIAVVCLTLWGLTAMLELLNDTFSITGDPVGTAVAFIMVLVFLAFPVIGAVIVARQPKNSIGWIFCAAGLSFAISNLAAAYAKYVVTNRGSLPGGDLMAWIDSWASIPGTSMTLTLLLLLFPTGRTLSRRWRWVVWVTVFSVFTLMAQYAFTPGPLEDYETVSNPLGVDSFSTILPAVEIIGGLGLLLSALLSIAALIVRFRRSHGIERQQMKWFAYAATLLIIVFIEAVIAMAYFDQSIDVTQILVALCWLAMTTATGLAILRYRLYDIDVIINRTMVYGLLTLSLGLVYGGSVISLQTLLQPLAPDSQLAIAGSTIAVAGLFHPARSRVQTVVDRRFYRAKYDGTQTIETFSARLRQEVDLNSLSVELIAVVRDTMEPSQLTLWLRNPEQAVKGGREPHLIRDGVHG